MSAAISYERVRERLERLKLDFALASLDVVLEQGQKREKTTVEVLDDLLGREISARFERRVAPTSLPRAYRPPKRLRASTSRPSPRCPRA